MTVFKISMVGFDRILSENGFDMCYGTVSEINSQIVLEDCI